MYRTDNEYPSMYLNYKANCIEKPDKIMTTSKITRMGTIFDVVYFLTKTFFRKQGKKRRERKKDLDTYLTSPLMIKLRKT